MNARVKTPGPGEAEPVKVLAADAPAQAAALPAPRKKSGRRFALMFGVPLVLAAIGGYFWLTGGRFVDTDNAYVQQAKVAISADVAGRIISVSVHDNQTVAAGDELFSIDPEPYRIALAQADAALSSARVNVAQLKVAFGTAKAKLAAAQVTLDIRQKEMDRKASLLTQGLTAEASMDDVRIALQAAETTVSLAEQELANAVAALGGNPEIAVDEHPAVRSALAAKDNAQRNLSKTTVMAPASGIVSQVASLNVGQFIAIGSTIASLVETGDTWVQANFKETQVGGLTAGMPAEIAIDAYPGAKLHGHVDSIGAATGSEFALIPAQNATGNWVKVVQRIPVRIKVDDANAKPLRTGMSATVAIDTKPETAKAL